jgi:gamma-glutamyltranspeptidase/glutathione hydrolase
LASPSTTHLSVATVDGALVAITVSNGYGSGITIPGTGIAWNNSLGEPELNPGGYLVASPSSRLVSNMAPTLARHPDGRAIAFGTPGASRITTALAQMWQAYTGDVLPLEQAIAAPRLHVDADRQPPVLLCEPGVDTRLGRPAHRQPESPRARGIRRSERGMSAEYVSDPPTAPRGRLRGRARP